MAIYLINITTKNAETLQQTENILSNLNREPTTPNPFPVYFLFSLHLWSSLDVGILSHNSHLLITRGEPVHRRAGAYYLYLIQQTNSNVCFGGVFNHRIDFIKLPFHSSSNGTFVSCSSVLIALPWSRSMEDL